MATTAANAVAAAEPPASPSRTHSVQLETLRQRVVELESEKDDLAAALKTTQEDAIAQVEAIQKMAEHEARVRDEDHANSIALLKRDMQTVAGVGAGAGRSSAPSTPLKSPAGAGAGAKSSPVSSPGVD
jgi:hypothetical protein